MKCETCGVGPEPGVTLIRQNALGEVGVWRCEKHNARPVDGETRRLLNTITGKGDHADD